MNQGVTNPTQDLLSAGHTITSRKTSRTPKKLPPETCNIPDSRITEPRHCPAWPESTVGLSPEPSMPQLSQMGLSLLCSPCPVPSPVPGAQRDITSARQPPTTFYFTLTRLPPQHPGQPALSSGCQPEAGNSSAATSLSMLKHQARSTSSPLRADRDQSSASQLLFLSFSFPSFHLTQHRKDTAPDRYPAATHTLQQTRIYEP